MIRLKLLITVLFFFFLGNSCIADDLIFGDDHDFWHRMLEADKLHQEQMQRKERKEKEAELDAEQALKEEELNQRHKHVAAPIADDSDDDSDRDLTIKADKEKEGSALVSVATTSRGNARGPLQGMVRKHPPPKFDDDLSDSRTKDRKPDRSEPEMTQPDLTESDMSVPHADDDDDDADQKEWSTLIAPQNLIGDWVPSKADPLNNGGFSHPRDNGRPVPYRLNGHIDMERKLPWVKDD